MKARCDFYSNLSFLLKLTASNDRTKYSLQRGKGKLCVGTVKIYCYSGIRRGAYNRMLLLFFFTGRWAYTWGLISEEAGAATGSLRYSLHPLGDVLPYTSHTGMCRSKGYGFCALLGLKTGIDFAHFSLESTMVYKGTTVVY